MRRIRGVLSLLSVLAIEVLVVVAFRRLTLSPGWSVDWSHLWRWMDAAPGLDVAIGLASWAGLVIAGWLVASTVAYLLASVLRIPGLIRATSLITLPGVRSVVERAAAVGLAAAVVLPAGAAFAQTGSVAAPVAVTAPAAPTPAVAPAVAPGMAAPAPVAPHAAGAHRTIVADDNFWDLAADELEAQLGRAPTNEEIAPYWRTMIDASMPMLSGDENLVFPGEVVVVPAAPGAVTSLAVAPVTPVTPVAPVTPAAPTPAPQSAVAAPTTLAPPVAPAVTAAPVTTIAQPATTVAAPTTLAPAPAVTAAVTTIAQPATTVAGADESAELAGEATTTADTPALSAAATQRQGPPVWVGGGLLAAGVVGALTRLRRNRNRLRLPGEILVPAGPALAQAELEARFAADVDGAEFTDLALRALSGLTWDQDTPPAPLGFILSETELDVILAEAAVAPLPFRGRGTHWLIGRDADRDELAELAGDRTMPLPSVITLGRDANRAEVVVDLEDPGMLSLVGEGAADIVRAAAIQLATAPWSQLIEVVLVGFDAPPGGPAVRSVTSLDEVIDELEQRAVQTAQLLIDAGCTSVFDARLQGVADDTWVPTIVVCATTPADHLARRLVGLVSSGEAAGVAALAVGPIPDSPWQLTIQTGGSIALDSFGTTVVVRQRTTGQEPRTIRDMLDTAAQAPILAPEVDGPPPVATDLIVDLYGPVRVGGCEFNRGKALEILTYLACHPGAHVDGDRLMAVMWPEGDPAKARRTLNTTMFCLRQVVGEEHVPKLGGSERLYTVLGVSTSVQKLKAALLASRTPGPQAMEALHAALERVEGRPFDSPSRAGHGGGRPQTAYEWAHGESCVAEAVRVAGDAAHRLVELALEEGRHDVARWAIRRGLVADPECEQLRRDEMRVARAEGDAAALEASMDAVIATARDCDEEPSPATVAAYRAAEAAIA